MMKRFFKIVLYGIWYNQDYENGNIFVNWEKIQKWKEYNEYSSLKKIHIYHVDF